MRRAIALLVLLLASRADGVCAQPEASAAKPGGQPAAVALEDSQPGPRPARMRLALHNAVAFGIADDPFVSDLLGARFDLRAAFALWLGAYAGYANLPGREGRVHGFLTYAQADQRIALGAGRSVSLPLRIALGYLARNGGFLRLATGLALPLGERTELVIELLAPSFWATRDKTLFSLDAGIELALEL